MPNVSRRLIGETAKIDPVFSEETMALHLKAQWEAASAKEGVSLKNYSVYTLLGGNARTQNHRLPVGLQNEDR